MNGYERLLAEVRASGVRMGQALARDHLEVLRDEGPATFISEIEAAQEKYNYFEPGADLFARMSGLADDQTKQTYDAFDSAVWDGVRAASGVSR